ncbi:uncharacterized protein LOC128261418 isoform X2 [Drosophila gunungcola]|uniref:uncharacterized protein LOC128261418 isoform X2 n=1 Tax=Drosophila gunungcola TaxID=103775 RepID=UPI0022E83447|nr:uncharacterized protein LOC128261418 isoform X2 [Drosophila gunungcola]
MLKNPDGRQRQVKFQIGDGLGANSKQPVNNPSDTQKTHWNCIPRSKPLKVDEYEDYQELQKVFQKLDMADQIILYRAYRLLPSACSALWRTTRKRLDFRTLHKILDVEGQNHLLVNMMDHFKYVYFVANKLQDNLNTLERAGVKSLNSVQRCELLLMDGESGKGMAQWPLHALPKLIRNVRRLRVHCNVQVHFIEHLEHLELLVLYGAISQTALTGVLERCQKLTRLFLKFDCNTLSLKSIDYCPKLRDFSLCVGLFVRQRELVIGLTDLRLLELTHCQKDIHVTLECLEIVLSQRPDSVELVQLDCSGFGDPNWMKEVGLDRCSQMRGLVLSNCDFYDREICQLALPRVQNHIALISCHDIKDYQVLDMVRRCPGLHDIYLIDCPQLSWKVLQGIYRIRKSENLNYPITVILSQCTELREYSNYWCFKLPYLKIKRIQNDSRPVENIQVFFNNKNLE